MNAISSFSPALSHSQISMKNIKIVSCESLIKLKLSAKATNQGKQI